jgi:hypothetical protein
MVVGADRCATTASSDMIMPIPNVPTTGNRVLERDLGDGRDTRPTMIVDHAHRHQPSRTR